MDIARISYCAKSYLAPSAGSIVVTFTGTHVAFKVSLRNFLSDFAKPNVNWSVIVEQT